MVRDATHRKAKYEAKIDADVQRARITALKSSMVEQMDSASADLATVETNVKAVLEAQVTPIYSIYNPMYLNIGRELYRIQKKFGGSTFQAESSIICDKWYGRGLNPHVVEAIGKLFGSSWTCPSS
jgi:uncharacterized protein (DUF342 family)